MKRQKLQAEERSILGKKVKKLRREGILPCNVYGKNLSSVAIQVKYTDFDQVFQEVGETGLVDLQVKNETRPVLIKNLQMNFHSHTPLHVDFYQVNLKEKVKTMVPLVLIGEAKAVTEKVGMLLQTLSEVEIEALPDQLPENIEVQVSTLSAIDEQVSIEDLKVPEGVTILTDAGQVVCKIAELAVEEPEPTVAETPAEGETTEASKEEAASETPKEEASDAK